MTMKNRLVAHRGDMSTYPENSLLALTKAAELGFCYLELDVQFSKDLTPIVIHDDNLSRTTGINANVFECTTKELILHRVLSAQETEEPAYLYLASLEKTVEVLNQYPDITLFVEIKRQCLEHVDLDILTDVVLSDLQAAKFDFVIISFVKEVVQHVQQKKDIATGWVMSKYDQVNQAIAKDLQPEYLFCNVKKINKPEQILQGPWKWVLYDIMNPAFAYELLEQGIDLIETGDIVKLSDSEYFQS